MIRREAFGQAERRQAALYLGVRLVTILLVAAVLLYLLAVTPAVPYHIRELFGSHPTPAEALLFALMALLALGPPALLGLQLIRQPRPWAWLFPVAVLLHAVLVFLIFRFATPIDSVHDLVGLPLWSVPAELERLVRFVGLFVVVSVSIAGGTALLYGITRAYAPLRLLWWLLYGALFFVLSFWIVIGLAATDNITVLLRWGGGALAWAALWGWLLIIAFGASLLAERLAGVFNGTLTALFALLLLLPISYGALFLATEPLVLGASSDLSALGFLLSGSRTQYLFGDLELFGRYSLAYVALMALLTFAQYPVWVAYATRRFAHNPAATPLRNPPEGAAAGSHD
jgi:hypothetical protein